MCGIVGIEFSDNVTKNDIFVWIKKTLNVSSRRGKDSSGISILFQKEEQIEIQTLRSENSSHSLLKSNSLNNLIRTKLKNNFKVRFIIAHTRLATNGDTININNQPLKNKKNNSFFVFNGIITNSDAIKKRFNLDKNFKNDGISLTILDQNLNYKKFLKGAFSFIQISSSNFPQMTYMTNNGSLYISKNLSKKVKTLLLSEESFFRQLDIKNCDKVKLNTLHKVSIKSKKIKKRKIVEKNILQKNKKVKVFDIVTPNIDQNLEKKINDRYEFIKNNIFRCKKCILPNTHPFIKFDSSGICNFCKNEKKIKLKNPAIIFKELNRIKKNFGEDKIMLALSGGRDSSYGLHLLVKKLGFKPRTYTYDWGLNTDLARRNVSIMTGSLGVENIIIAADLRKKREYVKKNVEAWLHKPHLGIVPLFMAGDKQFMSNAGILKKELNSKIEIFAANLHEVTQFKEEFSGIQMWENNSSYGEAMNVTPQIKMLFFYGFQFLRNPKYLNGSLIDSFKGFLNYYHAGVNKVQIFDYFDWEEDHLNDVLINKYGWETASDTSTTWRIGDGTAAFYNFIYMMFAGFTENDVIRSNLIRQGKLSRIKALKLIQKENLPRFPTLNWYLKLFDLNFNNTLVEIINKAKNSNVI